MVNVVTPAAGTTERPVGHVSGRFGTYALRGTDVDVQGKKGAWGYYGFASLLDSDGNLADSRTRERKGLGKVRYDFNGTVNAEGMFGYSGAALRYGPTSTRRIYDQPYISRYGRVALNVGKDDHEATVAYKYNDQDVTSDTYHSTTHAFLMSTVSRDFYQGVTLKDTFRFSPEQALTLGLDSDWHTLKSSNYLSKSASMNAQAPFAGFMLTAGHFDILPAVRADRNDHFGGQVSPSVGVVYHVPGWKEGAVRVKVARAFNAPPLLWLYNDDPLFLVAPNPDLKAERAHVYEAGIGGELVVPGLTGRLNGYRSDVRDAISVADIGGLYQSRNFEKFVRQGIEGRVDYQVLPGWQVFSSAAFNDVRNVQTKQVVRDAGVARLSYKWGSSLSMGSTRFTWQGYYNRWSAASDEPANDRKPIFDVKLAQDVGSFHQAVDCEVFVGIYNLTNSSYFSDPLYPLPGRHVEGGLKLTF